MNKIKNNYLIDTAQTTKIKKLLKKWVKEIYADELALDVEVSHIWLYRKIDTFKIELAITYTDPNGSWVGKKTEINVDIATMKIVGEKNE